MNRDSKYIIIIVLLLVLLAAGAYYVYWYIQDSKIVRAAATTLGGEPSPLQADSIRQIAKAWRTYGDGQIEKLAYILATTRHESRFTPIEEYRATPTQWTIYNRQNAYWDTGYYGRGFVQLTHQDNYSKMSDLVGVDLVKYPEKALEPTNAAKILVAGMMAGSFTRRPLDEFINNNTTDYYNARKVVNGLDRADLIKGYAQTIEKELKKWL